MMNSKAGYCEVSQQIRERISKGLIKVASPVDVTRFEQGREDGRDGWFSDDSLESRVQPSSFEPAIGDHAYVLDADARGLFRPNSSESVRRMLLQVPRGRRKVVGIDGGFELKKGFNYLIPLQDRIVLQKDEVVVSSPKSSRGRLFLNNRLLADYNASFDEIIGSGREGEIGLWLLLQPTKFNMVVHPGLTFNQLRFFGGESDSRLSDVEIRGMAEETPFLVESFDVGARSLPHVVHGGLYVHLDLEGKNTGGIAGLRARNNPEPIDLLRRDAYDAEDYFEPIIARGGGVDLSPGDFCLFASQGVLQIPANLSAELDRHSRIGVQGSLHDAGFIDNGFKGDLVFEVISGESERMVLHEGTPLSKLGLFRTNQIPDKVYGGTGSGSSYQGQVGPRTSNNFRGFDYGLAAKNYEKLDRLVLVQDREVLLRHRTIKGGFEFLNGRCVERLVGDVSSGFFHSRYDCEDDEAVLQPIPYVVLFGPNDTVFSYVRAEDIKDYGDERLFGKHSIGLGGHISKSDGSDFVGNCVRREVMEEEVEIEGEHSVPRLVGTLMAYDTPVDRVHFGLIYAMHVSGEVHLKDAALISGKMVGISELEGDALRDERYETWSRILMPSLRAISALSKPD